MSYQDLVLAAKSDNIEEVLNIISRMNVRDVKCYQQIRDCLVQNHANKCLKEFIRDVKYCRIHRSFGYTARQLLEDLELLTSGAKGTLNSPEYFALYK